MKTLRHEPEAWALREERTSSAPTRCSTETSAVLSALKADGIPIDVLREWFRDQRAAHRYMRVSALCLGSSEVLDDLQALQDHPQA